MALEPLLVLEPLEEFLDAAGLGSGPIEAGMIGDGHSNVTYLLARAEERLVLRRPPRGPLPLPPTTCCARRGCSRRCSRSAAAPPRCWRPARTRR